MGHDLIVVSDAVDWKAFHRIRREELFEARGRFGIYNDRHPDDHAAFAHPLLLKYNGHAVGTTRLDMPASGRAAVRLVAITKSAQGLGHGRVLGEMVDRHARALGVRELVVNAAAAATGFYAKTGWLPFTWDAAELVGIASTCVQMRKLLTA